MNVLLLWKNNLNKLQNMVYPFLTVENYILQNIIINKDTYYEIA